MYAKWTRIWCVLPLRSVTSSTDAPRRRSITRNSVTASRPPSITAMRLRSRGSRAIGASIVAVLSRKPPRTSAQYVRPMVRARNCSASAR